MKNLNNKQNRKAIKGFRLFYYRVLYSSFYFNDHIMLEQHIDLTLKMKDHKMLIRISIFCVLLLYLLIPIIILVTIPFFAGVSLELLLASLTLTILILPCITWIIVKYVLTSDKFINKISQFEEVIVKDINDKKHYIKIADWILFALIALWVFVLFCIGFILSIS